MTKRDLLKLFGRSPRLSYLPGWTTPVPERFQLYTELDDNPFMNSEDIIIVPAWVLTDNPANDITFHMPIYPKPGTDKKEWGSLYSSFDFDVLRHCRLWGLEIDMSSAALYPTTCKIPFPISALAIPGDLLHIKVQRK